MTTTHGVGLVHPELTRSIVGAMLAALCAAAVACARPRAASGDGDTTLNTIVLEEGGWTPTQRDSASAALERQRTLWTGRKPAAYRYAIAGTCFCLSSDAPQIVTVTGDGAVARPDTAGADGEGASAKRRGPGRPPFGTDGIDALFDSLAVAVRDTAIDAVRIKYEPRWGFPERVTLDRIARAVDDEYHIEVSRFAPLP